MEGLASEAPGCFKACFGMLLQKIKERGSKESQVEKKKNKEMRELEREDYLLVVYGVVVNGYLLGEVWRRERGF